MEFCSEASCPRCQHWLDYEAPHCSGCGLTLAALDELYGEEEVLLQRINDEAGVLDDAGRAALSRAQTALEAQFPQLFVAVFIGQLVTLPTLRQFGFWLLNRGAVLTPEGEAPRANEYGLLILMDPEHGLLGVEIGSQLEPWLSEAVLKDLLEAARPVFQRRSHGRALAWLTDQLRRALERAYGRWRQPRRWTFASPLAGLRRLRPRRPSRPNSTPPAP